MKQNKRKEKKRRRRKRIVNKRIKNTVATFAFAISELFGRSCDEFK